jgi:ABC-type dipeptide/oligopeptide/nickel transport system ATPase subunit
MKLDELTLETALTCHLQMILNKTNSQINDVKEIISVLGAELNKLNKEPDEEDKSIIDQAAHFIALANVIKYQVKAELEHRRKYELN